MKKSILIGILYLAILPIKAITDTAPSSNQDSTKQKNLRSLNFDADGLIKSMEFDFQFEIPDFEFNMQDFEFDIPDMQDFQFEVDSANIRALKGSFGPSKGGYKNLRVDLGVSSDIGMNQNTEKKPTRVEKKSFQNIKEIEIDHKYGNIIVKESSTNQVEVEIQYFDSDKNKAVCDISSSKSLLSIVTTSANRNSSRINYIINVPQSLSISATLKNGNLKLDDHKGNLSTSLSYSNIDAKSLSGQTNSIDVRYGNVNITSVKDISFSAVYSKVKIEKAQNIEISGQYTDYVLDDVTKLKAKSASSYNNFKIGTVTDMAVDLRYSDVTIENLISSFNSKSSYSDITINSISPKLDNITMYGSYSDMIIFLPDDFSAAFEATFKYGDLNISKKHQVSYTKQIDENNRIEKTGIIGNSKTPKATIKVSNSYADIRIR